MGCGFVVGFVGVLSRFVVVRGAPPRDPEAQNSTTAARGYVPRKSGVVLDVEARSELLKNTSERVRAPGCI